MLLQRSTSTRLMTAMGLVKQPSRSQHTPHPHPHPYYTTTSAVNHSSHAAPTSASQRFACRCRRPSLDAGSSGQRTPRRPARYRHAHGTCTYTLQRTHTHGEHGEVGSACATTHANTSKPTPTPNGEPYVLAGAANVANRATSTQKNSTSFFRKPAMVGTCRALCSARRSDGSGV